MSMIYDPEDECCIPENIMDGKRFVYKSVIQNNIGDTTINGGEIAIDPTKGRYAYPYFNTDTGTVEVVYGDSIEVLISGSPERKPHRDLYLPPKSNEVEAVYSPVVTCEHCEKDSIARTQSRKHDFIEAAKNFGNIICDHCFKPTRVFDVHIIMEAA